MLAPHGHAVKTITVFAAITSFTNFLEGYSSAYPNTASQTFRQFINASYSERHSGQGMSNWAYTWLWSLLLNIWFIGYLLGTFITPLITEMYGRKLGTIVSVASIVIKSPEVLIFGRAIGAMGSGVAYGALILFMQETTPTVLRGTCSFLSEVSYSAINVVGMGFGMDIAFGKNLIALIGFSLLPGILSILIIFPMKESPKYLLINKNNRKDALDSLIFYRGKNIDLDKTLDEILKEADNKQMNMTMGQRIFEVFQQPHLRRAVIIGILSLQIIVGIWPIIYISSELLSAHFEVDMAQLSSFVFIVGNFIASIIGMCVVEKFGRRPMLLVFGILNTVFLCVYICFDRLAFYIMPQFKYGCVVSLICYGITYGAALGPIAFFITSELVPQQFRSIAQSIVFAINTIVNFLFSFATLPLYRLIDVWSFIPLFVLPSICSITYLYFFMPETRGLEIHEIVAQLKKDADKKFKMSIPNLISKNFDNGEILRNGYNETLIKY